MSTSNGVLREFLRGNTDVQSFLLPAFYLGCKARFAHMTRADIEQYQQTKAHNIIRYATRYSPFFAEHYRGHDLRDRSSLPTVDKELMMANLGRYNTLGLSRQGILDFCLEVERKRDFSQRYRGVTIGMSSGTSGNKGVEITSAREERYLRAALFSRLPRPKGKINLAFILRVSSPAFQIDRFGHHLTYLNQMNRIDMIVARLEQLDPNVISAPPSMLRMLAAEIEAGRLTVAPAEIISYAEVLYPEDKTYLTEVFGCPLFEIYKATEGAIAISCHEGSLHLNEDLIAVELFAADGTPAAAGEPAQRMLVTDLHKTSQPILRYELNDLLTLSRDRCSCGSAFRVIEQIQGRADDIFWSVRTDDGGYQFIYPDFLRRAIIVLSDAIRDYQVIQQDLDAVTVHLSVRDEADRSALAEAVAASVGGVFVAHGCHPPQVHIDFSPPAASGRAAKLVRIRRAFAKP